MKQIFHLQRRNVSNDFTLHGLAVKKAAVVDVDLQMEIFAISQTFTFILRFKTYNKQPPPFAKCSCH